MKLAAPEILRDGGRRASGDVWWGFCGGGLDSLLRRGWVVSQDQFCPVCLEWTVRQGGSRLHKLPNQLHHPADSVTCLCAPILTFRNLTGSRGTGGGHQRRFFVTLTPAAQSSTTSIAKCTRS